MLNQVQRSQEYMLRVNTAISLEFNMSEGKGKCKQIIWDMKKCLPQPGRTDKKKADICPDLISGSLTTKSDC